MKDKNELLSELNSSQAAAVAYCDGPALVIAGAGSGKTRVLTYKIAYLLELGLAPSSILALTFTNKAAREMKSRIASLVGEKHARYLFMGTFHSIFSRILRTEADKIGYTKNFSIYDSADSKSLINSIIKELALDDKIYKPAMVHSHISFAKNSLITPRAYSQNADLVKSDQHSRIPRTSEIYAIYCNRCRQADAMDFDDLLLNTNLLFRDKPDILNKYQNAFRYILVDEYQDTNFAQYMIVRKLAERHEHVCVVGDDAQSIYSFRGANIDNILQFRNSYKNAQVFKLERNYRSTKNIVNAANSLIDKNVNRLKKTVFSEKEDGEKIKVFCLQTDLEEGNIVAQKISDLHQKENFSFEDMAVLYRTNAQSRVLEDAMRKAGIPHRIYGGLSFYQRKEIKDVIAYCRLVCNLNDEEALKRIINVPARGIGDTTVGKITETAATQNVSTWSVLADPLRYNLAVNAGTAAKLGKFRNMILACAELSETLNAYELVTNIVKTTGIFTNKDLLALPEDVSRQENIEELLKAIHEFCGEKLNAGNEDIFLADFLAEVSLISDQDTKENSDIEKVTLMTVHAAKGLEFRAVFVVGMEEDLFPSMHSIENARDLEEERRLFYVALTRAEERCFISYAKSRFRNGKTTFGNPSRFIKDIDKQYLVMPKEDIFEPKKHFGDWDNDFDFERKNFYSGDGSFNRQENAVPHLTKISATTITSATPVVCNIPVGAIVKHQAFGTGKVLSTTLDNGSAKAEIDFGAKGKKTLLLKFARLEIVSNQ